MAAVAHGWVRVEREVRQRNGLAWIHVATCLAYLRDRGRKRIARGMGEDRASWYDHKQRMTNTETWGARRKVGPDVADEKGEDACAAAPAEIRKIEGGLLLKTGRADELKPHDQRSAYGKPNEQS